MVDDRLRRRTELQGAVHAAMDDLHQITGRTDQSPQQIAALHPDHPAVAAWKKATDEVSKFDREGRKP